MVSIQFGVLEAAKRTLVQRREAAGQSTELSIADIAGCGSLSGLATAFISAPVEHVRIRMQVQGASGAGPQYKGSVDAFSSILRTHGLTKLFQGFGATVARETLGYAGYFSTYELTKRALMGPEGEAGLGLGHFLFAGSVAGFGMWMPMYPLDVIKSKMQTDTLTGVRKYPNVSSILPAVNPRTQSHAPLPARR